MSSSNKNVDSVLIAESIKTKRKELKLSHRAVEKATGISASTISRLENLKGIPDSDTLVILAGWLECPLERLLGKAADAQAPVVYYQHESVPEIVAAHLRRDPNLSPENAEKLNGIFRTAYEQFSKFQLKGAR